jgi:hypothetical protein
MQRKISFKLPNGSRVPAIEDLEDGYTYDCFLEYKGKPVMVSINDYGVRLEWDSNPDPRKTGRTVITNIVPDKLFGKLDRLRPKHIRLVLSMLDASGLDGKTISSEIVNEMYEEWLRLGQP